GSCGKLAIVAGSEGFAGAGELCAKAAVRCGAGLVTVGVPHTLMEVYQAKFTEPMTLALPSRDGKICMDALAAINKLTEKRDAVAIGPGLGRSRDLQSVLEHAVKTVKSPLVIDADGLNNLEGNTKWLLERKGATVLTPHPVELARLLGCDAEAVLEAPVESAEKMSKEYGAVVALKCGTNIVASPDGQTTFCLSGNAGMATGGSGDVLTGVILALLGSGLSAYDAARIGCHINGCAGDMAAEKYGERSMIPSDTIEALPEAIEAMSEC
ncbi:MAG: NAD(P)H-hydrate dehydratase, partial [Bacillota bacterium]|nr:NAD(P)H-hydrate dehydratase [Bacillota bacterium]